MSKIAKYLQSHLSGTVLDDAGVCEHFSTDGSILSIKPDVVVYPRSTNDIRKVARFAWQLAEKGHILPLTARGFGTDTTGAAIGKGALVVFPAYLNRILELDTQQKLVRVEPGVNFKSLQETLQTHGLLLPSYPASYQYSSIGGALANNSSGEQSLKYGAIVNYVEKMEIVLANGELIQTGRMSKKQVEKKKGLATLEGEIYRAVDGLLDEYAEAVDSYYDKQKVVRDGVGYDLRDVKRHDGSIDLTSLFVGSQGTLGLISEVILKTVPHNPHTTLLVAAFDSVDDGMAAIRELRNLEPASLSMIDSDLAEFAQTEKGVVFPDELAGKEYLPAMLLFSEFDNEKRIRDKKVKRAKRVLQTFTDRIVLADTLADREKMFALRDVTAGVVMQSKAGKAALPILQDVSVPFEQLPMLLAAIRELSEKHHVELPIWGDVGDGILNTYPLFDLSKLPDRQKALKCMQEYYTKVVEMGGSLAAHGGDGRLRAAFADKQLDPDMTELFEKLKQSFDPHGILNPEVKVGVNKKQILESLRKDYSLGRWADHLPRN